MNKEKLKKRPANISIFFTHSYHSNSLKALTLKILVQKSKRKDIGFEHFEFQKSTKIIVLLEVFVLGCYLFAKWCQRHDIEAATQPPPSTSSHKKETSMTSPSSPMTSTSSSTHRWEYDVFLSFRVKVHESIGLLDKLKAWSLENCVKLQTLPRRLVMESLEYFYLSGSSSLENFPDLDPEMKRLRILLLNGTRIREFPFSNSIYQFQNLSRLRLPTNIPIPSCNSFDGYGFSQLGELTLSGENVTKLDDLDVDYFPELCGLDLINTNIVTIPESFIKFTRLSSLKIVDCKHFEEIQGLPQSLHRLKVRNCPSWNLQSSNKILSQVIAKKIAKWKQVGESQGILADRVHEGDRSSHVLYRSIGFFKAPGFEIPDEFNHRNNENSRCIPIAVCVTFVPINEYFIYMVDFVVNGCSEYKRSGLFKEGSEACRMWFISNSMYEWEKKLRDSNLSKQSHFEVICRISRHRGHGYKKPMDPTAIPKKLGVHVECICCPHKSSIPDSLPLLPLFPTSCHEKDSGHAIAMETTNTTRFEYDAKRFHGYLNVSFSFPIDPEVHPLIPLPYSSNMDHEAFETVSDLGHLKDFRNDGSDLSLSLNDSDASERVPPQVPDTSNGSNFVWLNF
nr:disease resistance protein rml1a [Quercus suber]